MKEIFIKLIESLTINQNFIWLVLVYFGVWFADKHGSKYLCIASWALFILIGISVLICLIFYTIDYCTKKWRKSKSYK